MKRFLKSNIKKDDSVNYYLAFSFVIHNVLFQSSECSGPGWDCEKEKTDVDIMTTILQLSLRRSAKLTLLLC